MKQYEETKSFVECFTNFVSDAEGLTREELDIELRECGIDMDALDRRVAEIVKKGSEEHRLSWRKHALERREAIETLLSSKKVTLQAADLKKKILQILKGDYGQGALNYAETYFRKRDSFSEKDMESLIEDLEDLNLLDKSANDEE